MANISRSQPRQPSSAFEVMRVSVFALNSVRETGMADMNQEPTWCVHHRAQDGNAYFQGLSPLGHGGTWSLDYKEGHVAAGFASKPLLINAAPASLKHMQECSHCMYHNEKFS